MSATIGLCIDNGASPPIITGDLKWLTYYLVGGHLMKWNDWPDVIGDIAERFQVNLAPLERVFDPNNAEAEAMWEATAQPPGELGDCLRRLVEALMSNPNIFDGMDLAPSHLKSEHLQRIREYFIEGQFLRDLADLLQKVEWAEKNGVERVHLYYG